MFGDLLIDHCTCTIDSYPLNLSSYPYRAIGRKFKVGMAYNNTTIVRQYKYKSKLSEYCFSVLLSHYKKISTAFL